MRVRVAYLNYAVDPDVGVLNKLEAQARAARESELPLDVLILSPSDPGDTGCATFVPLGETGPWPVRMFRRHALAYGAILRATDLSAYGRIVLRAPRAIAFPDREFLERCGDKLVMEYHSDDVAQILTSRYYGLRRLLMALAQRNSPRVLSRVRGLIGVTEEIRALQVRRAGRPLPSAVVSNGTDVAATPFTAFRPFAGDTLEVVFVASHFAPWQGLDRLEAGLRRWRGPARIRALLVGRVPGRAPGGERRFDWASLHYPGSLRGEALEEVFRTANLAVGSLAVHRNGLREACALKTRDYMARGLPFVQGHADPDIPDASGFVLRVPPDDTPLDAGRLVEFAGRASGSPQLSSRMREFAFQHLDWRVKMKALVEFATGIE